PVANAQAVTTPEDTAKAITLTASDVDGNTLTYSVVTGPAHGTLSGTAPNLTYTPTANYTGADSFTFEANDGTVDSALATISITVTEGTPSLSMGDASVVEGNSGTTPMVFTATLSPASSVSVTVNYATLAGTATSNKDYQATSGTLTFAAGQTSQTVTVLVNGDTNKESNETIAVRLSDPINATITKAAGS